MCGIAGFFNDTIQAENADNLIESMLSCMAYRGPDARGKKFMGPMTFGHNRLSIIDLKESANQPMEYDEAVLIFNGEIYNYIEIKEELLKKGYSFRTDSDTEVVLASYRAFGKDCVKRFTGMWAFAIWDRRNNQLFCSRDRFGIKPFYYISLGKDFYFGSEYKALKSTPAFKNDINLAQVSRGLQLGWVCYHDESYFSYIKILPEACNLILKDGKVSIERYWQINPASRLTMSSKDKEEKFRDMFLESILIHMRADVEVGGCLSGGLDSSSIASAVSFLFPSSKFRTFTIYYEGEGEVDERPWVREVLKKYPLLDDHTFSPSDNDIQDALPKVLEHAEVPIAGSSPFSQYFVMKLARKNNIKVLLDGQGADEYLAGYMHSFYRLLGGLLSRLKISSALKEFSSHASFQNFSLLKRADVFSKSMLAGFNSEQSLYEMEYYRYFPFLSKDNRKNFRLEHNSGSNLNNFLYHLTFTTSLPSLLHYEDRNSMAFSIESRVPFLDHRLVEFAFSLEDEDKFHMGITKNILRRSLKGIVPDSILNRKDKKGFVTPGEVKWLRGPLRHLLEDFKYNAMEFIDTSKVKKLILDFKKGDNSKANLVWRCAMLNYWLKNNC